MNSFKFLLTFYLVVLCTMGCKKEEHVSVPLYVPTIAPCEVQEEIFTIDAITYGPSVKFPNAHLVISFTNTSMQIAFNKIPATGLYHMVPNLVGSYSFDNQIATVEDSGSFQAFSSVTDLPEVYIENYNNELIISYCDLPNGGTYTFDPSINAYVGNPDGKRKIRMSY